MVTGVLISFLVFFIPDHLDSVVGVYFRDFWLKTDCFHSLLHILAWL